ncbi:transcription elongation factor [Auriscalpium vulgare]|uniref:Transcription elongation factor n=1 Tax=Auriscalpium vulgare TaxID=40419 RepID=A0ACB8RW38_9AGAM|nr:transcription elongation factor [Auriscalpium vulgare]
MTPIEELKRLTKSLQSAKDEKEIVDLLQLLKKEAKITEAILRESRVGLAVGKLRSHAKKEVSELAKEVVRKWKTEVDKEKQATGATKAPGQASKAAAAGERFRNTARCFSLNGGLKAPRKASTASAAPPTPTSLNNGQRTTKSDGIDINVTKDKTRDRCIELLYDGLAADSVFPSELILSRARAIEETVLADSNGTTAAYKSRIRTLYVNLKDKNNPSLRENVVSGDIAANKFARMSSQDMASEERKAADSKIKEDNLFLAMGAAEQQAETDAFQCGRCKQRKCRYRQAQTRSADEPMTTFVTCTNCNNRWKFS